MDNGLKAIATHSLVGGDVAAAVLAILPHFFRVPIPLREVSVDSYIPRCCPLGLYGHATSLTNFDSIHKIFRRNFAEIFMRNTGKDWSSVCLSVLGDSVEDWTKLYGDFPLHPQSEDGPARRSERRSLEATKILLVLDTIFVVLFIQGDHQINCKAQERRSRCPALIQLKEQMNHNLMFPLVPLILVDIFRFENQIPLGLLKKAIEMIVFEGSQPGDDPFRKFLIDAMELINFFPGPLRKGKFREVLEAREFTDCKHLLECLYSMITYKSQYAQEKNAKVTVARAARTAQVAANANRVETREAERVAAREANEAATAQRVAARDASRAQRVTANEAAIAQRVQATAERVAARAARVAVRAQATTDGVATIAQRIASKFDEIQHLIHRWFMGDVNRDAATRQAEALGETTQQVPSGRLSEQVEITPDSGHGGDAVDSAVDQPAANPNLVEGDGARNAQPLAPEPRLCFDESGHELVRNVPTMTQLRKAGIKVEVGQGKCSANWISEVSFKRNKIFTFYNGTLYVPEFSVYEGTEVMLRNLLAYESVVERKTNLYSYVLLMHHLINSEEDVKLMRENGVLGRNSLGSDKLLANMWNRLPIRISGGLNEPYSEVFDSINRHYENACNQWFAEFYGLYLRRPWLFGGATLLSLSAVASLGAMTYTIMTYYYGTKQRLTT